MIIPIGRETEDAAVKTKLCFERASNIFRTAETVLLAGEQQISHRNRTRFERRDQPLGLIRRHDAILRALKKNHRTVETLGVMNRRTLAIAARRLRIWPDEALQIA